MSKYLHPHDEKTLFDEPYYNVQFATLNHKLHDIGHATRLSDARKMARDITGFTLGYENIRNNIKQHFGVNEVCKVYIFHSGTHEGHGQWDFVPNPPH